MWNPGREKNQILSILFILSKKHDKLWICLASSGFLSPVPTGRYFPVPATGRGIVVGRFCGLDRRECVVVSSGITDRWASCAPAPHRPTRWVGLRNRAPLALERNSRFA